MNFALLLVVFAVVAAEAPAPAEAKEVPAETAPAAKAGSPETPPAGAPAPPASSDTAAPATPATPDPAPAMTPAPSAAAPGVEKKSVGFGEDGTNSLSGTIALRMAQSVGNPLQLDETGTSAQPTPFDLRLRFGLDLKLDRFSVVSEFDVATGAVFGTPDTTVVAPRIPTPAFQPAALRALYLQYKWETGAARLGVQTNQFGLGMLSNSGSRDAEPGDFGQQFGGVVVARAGFAARPLFGLGGAWRAVEPVAAFDFVLNDQTVNAFAGDVAFQGIWGLRFNVDEQHQLAITGVYRSARRPSGAPGERSTDVLVGDLYGRRARSSSAADRRASCRRRRGAACGEWPAPAPAA